MAKKKKASQSIPARSDVSPADTWDLASLYADDAAWEKDFAKWKKQVPKYEDFRGTLAEGPQQLAACLKFDAKIDRLAERLGTYAFLKTAEDATDSTYQAMLGRFQNLASQAGQAASFISPEILAIPRRKMETMLADKSLKQYRLQLERQLRFRPHTLSDREEKLLAMQSEMATAAGKIFRQLTDADMKFGSLKDERGETVELSHATLSKFLHSPKRSVRSKAFHQYYAQFSAHENALAASLAGSMQKDVYYAQARGYESALQKALFADNVPLDVYDNLIAAVRAKLPVVHRYFDMRRRKLRLKDIHHYDTYVPMQPDFQWNRTWNQAVKTVVAALEPLGNEYCSVLEAGLQGRWCDRYPNRGKQSGAFSCGSFDGEPYILMNYQPDVPEHMFTLAHEAGHSMHSYYSAKTQPYIYYDYTIFVAEVASTFNEQLLSQYLMENCKDEQERAYLINREIDAIRATLVRQTMFAEFEKICHAKCEAGEPLTLEAFRTVYRELLNAYFGDDFTIDDELDLECLRIPHFYRAFYVYQYATGLSAAIALAQRVSQGGKKELNDYLGFLKGGCSKYSIDLLRGAGVDMEQREPVEAALDRMEHLIDEFEQIG